MNFISSAQRKIRNVLPIAGLSAGVTITLPVLLTCVFFGATAAKADAFLDNFDSITVVPSYTGTSLANDAQVNYGAISPYFQYGNGFGNGIVTNCVSYPTPNGCGYVSGNELASDASGTGNFLFTNTAAVDNNSGNNIFYQSNVFAVDPNTDYVFSFYVANATNPNYPGLVDSSIDGTNFAEVVVNGTVSQWLKYSFDWNSGSNTLATITLSDPNTNAYGNDFGVDNIDLTAVPEPSTLSLFGAAILSFLGFAAYRRRKQTGAAV